MAEPCPTCGLKTWDAEDLIPGDYVCTCNEDPDDDDMQCPCGGDCWDNVRVMPAIETVTAFSEAGLL